MKTTLLLLVFAAFGIHAQTTYDLDWGIGIGTNLDLTINVGDIVRWTWIDDYSHTVQSDPGSTETFNSGTKTGSGSTFSYTFSMVGIDPYHCGYHPFSMAGTITVQKPLGVDEFSLKDFSVSPNPAFSKLQLKFPDGTNVQTISIFNVLGQQIYSNNNIENTIDISNLNKGLYFLKVEALDFSHTKRFIKL